ncbi:MAG: iron ABC transporter permease [Hyphomonadaceae bacterium]|nr:iron ABC transporter permease [Hyphomonadaceae bacterium]
MVARDKWQQPLIIAGATAVIVVAIGPPLVATLGQLIGVGDALAPFATVQVWRLLVRSLLLAATVTALALAIGVPLGITFARARMPFQRLLFGAHVSILFLPPFLPTLGLFHLFGREGYLGGPLSAALLFSDLGCALALTITLLPAVTALTAIGARGVDASLEEAARIAGGPWRAAAFVVAPNAAPAIALAGVVVFALAFSELGVPMFLRTDVYPALVFSRLGGMDFAPGEAAAFALPLVVLAGALMWIEQRLAGGRAVAALGGGLRARAPLFAFHPVMLGFSVLAACASLAPVAALLAHGAENGGFVEASRWIGAAPFNSVLAASLAAALMTAAGAVLGVSLAWRGVTGVWFDRFTVLVFLLPSAILGIGVAIAWNHSATNWLYASVLVLVVAYVARYSALATRTVAAAIVQTPRSLDNAARTIGAGYLERLKLQFGIAPQALLGAFALTLVFSLRDLETAVLLYPPGGEPLTARIFTLEANGPPGVVSALAVLHVLITFGAIGLAWLTLGQGSRHD